MLKAHFDDVIHAPLRLRICGLLRPVDRLDFAVLRTALEVSDATLSKHLRTLAEAGYLVSDKMASAERGDARRVMWLSLSGSGRAALDGYLQALRDIAGTL
ncbi:transcriptional regulator [Arthrobacter sp. B0490]|uniref:transcriptional regulator n=1 Tax=Arthrobacter sp. B0490 TaxID=2058891 RepID=UPI000CE4B09E|nr:transcriptional regulator [Arthrobacter sp. B0490]